MLKKLLLALCLGFFLTGAAQAQTVLSLDINKAVLTWDWSRGTEPGVNDGDVAEFRMKCGAATGTYTKVTVWDLTKPRRMPVKEAIDGSGTWFCAAFAANEFGESGPSNEVNFRAGTVPNAPTGTVIVSE